MEKPTLKQIENAAKKSRKAAIDASIHKYLYLMSLTAEQVSELSSIFIKDVYCSLCIRYLGHKRWHCPLSPEKAPCNGKRCCKEWHDMYRAFENPFLFYNQFISNATRIYTKLLEIRKRLK